MKVIVKADSPMSSLSGAIHPERVEGIYDFPDGVNGREIALSVGGGLIFTLTDRASKNVNISIDMF